MGANFYEMAKKVDSREAFLRFVQALAEDAEAANAQPVITADGKRNLSPGGLENGSVAAFLGAMSAWAEGNYANSGEPHAQSHPSWRMFAEILHSGKFYE